MKKILFALAVIVFANSTASAQCGKVRVFGGNHKLFGGGLFKRNHVVQSCQPLQVVSSCQSTCAQATVTATPQSAQPAVTKKKVEAPSPAETPPPKKAVKTSSNDLGTCPYATRLDG
jgi:hypothetical protein